MQLLTKVLQNLMKRLKNIYETQADGGEFIGPKFDQKRIRTKSICQHYDSLKGMDP